MPFFMVIYIFVGKNHFVLFLFLCKKSKRNIHEEVIYSPSGKFGCLAIVSRIYKTDTKIVYALRNAFWSTFSIYTLIRLVTCCSICMEVSQKHAYLCSRKILFRAPFHLGAKWWTIAHDLISVNNFLEKDLLLQRLSICWTHLAHPFSSLSMVEERKPESLSSRSISPKGRNQGTIK
jgi:hypothetical protein